ncbi:LOW QUALITY PROTEIN: hypothetical protein Cgig2_012079 [Carnegiea gigantea]|uniref:Uncharacterized protein n=1 Tax=Carnegiea gigantea TaxID=171969 RepID=A0A9Q1GYG0_9CARY|nr:LOW QUALITY PROTEIN: hypothetical protein Cgig2_012079 [Carnegiea gigantea]
MDKHSRRTKLVDEQGQQMNKVGRELKWGRRRTKKKKKKKRKERRKEAYLRGEGGKRAEARASVRLTVGREATTRRALVILKEPLKNKGEIKKKNSWTYSSMLARRQTLASPSLRTLSSASTSISASTQTVGQRGIYGIALEPIQSNIIRQPTVYVRNVELFKDIKIRAEETWGIPRDSRMFLYGASLLGCLSERGSTAGVACLRALDGPNVRAIMKQHPNCLLLSEAKIKRSQEFFMNELDYKPAVIESRLALLICSLEKQIIPRHKVLLVLREKGLISRNYPLYRVVCLIENYSAKRFVLPIKDVHVVYEECSGRTLQQLTAEKADIHFQRIYVTCVARAYEKKSSHENICCFIGRQNL